MAFMDFLPQFGDNTTPSSDNAALAEINLKRKLALADSLRNTSMPQGQMVGNRYVAPSWTQYLAGAVQQGLAGSKEREALKEYADIQKAEKSKLSQAFNDYITGKGPKDVTTTQDNFVTQPLQEGANVPTSPFQTNEQVGQIAPNYAGQSPVMNMSGNTTVNQPVTSTTQVPRTKQELMANALKYINATGNTDLASKAVLGDIENMFKAPEVKIGNVEPKDVTPDSLAKFAQTHDYNDLHFVTKDAAPTVRTMRVGLNEVTQQYDPQSKSWIEIAKGPAFKPDAENAVFSPEVLNAMADQALAGDKSVFTGLGRGQQGAKNIVALRTAINNKMLENGLSGRDIAAKNAEFMGLMAGERAVGTRGANIELAGSGFENIVPIAQQASAKVARSGFLPFGKAEIMFDEQTNNPALSEFAAANNGLINTYARAISPTGVPTVEDKKHARKILSEAKDQEAYNAAVTTLQKEIQAEKRAPAEVRSSLRNQISPSGSGAGKVIHWNDLPR